MQHILTKYNQSETRLLSSSRNQPWVCLITSECFKKPITTHTHRYIRFRCSLALVWIQSLHHYPSTVLSLPGSSCHNHCCVYIWVIITYLDYIMFRKIKVHTTIPDSKRWMIACEWGLQANLLPRSVNDQSGIVAWTVVYPCICFHVGLYQTLNLHVKDAPFCTTFIKILKSINHKNLEIFPQNDTKQSRKNTCFVRGVLLTISAPSKGQACYVQKHKNRKRRAQGART